MSAKTIAVGPVLLLLAAPAAHAERVLVVIKGVPPNQEVQVAAPALGGAPVRVSPDPLGVVMTLLDVANAGKTQLAVQREDCAGRVRLSIVDPGAAEARKEAGCARRLGPPVDVDHATSPGADPTLRIYIQYDSLTASASRSPSVGLVAAQQKPPAVSPPVPTTISVKDARAGVKGAKVVLVGLTPGLPAEAVTVTTDVIGVAKVGLEPGEYVYQVEAEGYVRSEGKTTIGGRQVQHRLDVRLTDSDQKVYFEDRWRGRPGTGPFGTFSVNLGFAENRLEELRMTGSTNEFGDSLNGVRFSTMQNTESVERQNDVFRFEGKNDGPGFRIGAGLGEVELGDRKLSFGGGIGVSNVDMTLDLRLVDPSATGFRTTEWGADGPLFEFDFGAALSGFVEDKLWFFVRVGAGKADLDGAVRSPSLGGNGVTVIQDNGQIQLETFNVTTGAWYTVKNAAFMAAYRYSSADVTLEGSGALSAAVPQGTLRRDFSFLNAFDQDSHQLVGGVDVRVWKSLWASLTGAVGSGSKSVGFGLKYLRSK